MTGQNIIDRFRVEIIGDLVKPLGWNNSELINFINDWTYEILEDCYAIEDAITYLDSTNNAECIIDITSGTHTYSISTGFSKIVSAKYGSLIADDLELYTRKRMVSENEDWQTEASGTPTRLITEGVGLSKIRLWPTPNANSHLYLWTYMIVFSPISSDNLDESPEIRPEYHRLIFNYMAYRAYGKQDSATYDAEKSASYKELWIEDRRQIKLLEIRRRDRIVNKPSIGLVHEGLLA
jgi:hypothetical protein